MRKIPRRLARAPIPLLKAGLGFLFAGRLVMVEHTGRTTGQQRYVVLEVLLEDRTGVVVAAGCGRASQWLRNVEATPNVRLWWGRVRGASARAEILDGAKTRTLLERYRRERSRQAQVAAKSLGVPALAQPEQLPDDIAQQILLVHFRRT